MNPWLIDLDGSVASQPAVAGRCRLSAWKASDWGPGIRLGCSFRRFWHFSRCLQDQAPGDGPGPLVTLYGSGDFHHVSLALLARLREPFNLLVVDKHPDWMRGIPFLHCGTWVYHAARLPKARRIFHVGGELDFDNNFRWLAPWPFLASGRVTVFPAVRRFRGRAWGRVPHEPIRDPARDEVSVGRLEALLRPLAADLKRWPLYVSVDKDVMVEDDAVVNWDSGHLRLAEVCTVLAAFLRLADGRLAGADLVGDWSPVRVSGLCRRWLHLTEHPPLAAEPGTAATRNERANLALLDCLTACEKGRGRGAPAVA